MQSNGRHKGLAHLAERDAVKIAEEWFRSARRRMPVVSTTRASMHERDNIGSLREVLGSVG